MGDKLVTSNLPLILHSLYLHHESLSTTMAQRPLLHDSLGLYPSLSTCPITLKPWDLHFHLLTVTWPFYFHTPPPFYTYFEFSSVCQLYTCTIPCTSALSSTTPPFPFDLYFPLFYSPWPNSHSLCTPLSRNIPCESNFWYISLKESSFMFTQYISPKSSYSWQLSILLRLSCLSWCHFTLSANSQSSFRKTPTKPSTITMQESVNSTNLGCSKPANFKQRVVFRIGSLLEDNLWALGIVSWIRLFSYTWGIGPFWTSEIR